MSCCSMLLVSMLHTQKLMMGFHRTETHTQITLHVSCRLTTPIAAVSRHLSFFDANQPAPTWPASTQKLYSATLSTDSSTAWQFGKCWASLVVHSDTCCGLPRLCTLLKSSLLTPCQHRLHRKLHVSATLCAEPCAVSFGSRTWAKASVSSCARQWSKAGRVAAGAAAPAIVCISCMHSADVACSV